MSAIIVSSVWNGFLIKCYWIKISIPGTSMESFFYHHGHVWVAMSYSRLSSLYKCPDLFLMKSFLNLSSVSQYLVTVTLWPCHMKCTSSIWLELVHHFQKQLCGNAVNICRIVYLYCYKHVGLENICTLLSGYPSYDMFRRWNKLKNYSHVLKLIINKKENNSTEVTFFSFLFSKCHCNSYTTFLSQ